MLSIESSRSSLRLRVFATFALGLVVGLGCSSGQVLTQGEIGRRGARSFTAPPATVYYACIGALLANGYEIERDDIEQGVIVTRPRAVSGGGPVTARAYRLTVDSDDHGGTRVVAAPVLYAAGGRDVSNRELWNLEGPGGEHHLWTELFGDIDAALAHPAPDPGQREELAKVAVPATDPAAAKMLSPESGLRPATLAPAGRPASGSGPDSGK